MGDIESEEVLLGLRSEVGIGVDQLPGRAEAGAQGRMFLAEGTTHAKIL